MYAELIDRLRAKVDSGRRTLGGLSFEPIMVLRNPDGPEAADALAAMAAEVEAKDARIAELEAVLSFDCTSYPDMEEAAIRWANHIAGPKGKPGNPPDPVMLLEICENIAATALTKGQSTDAG